MEVIVNVRFNIAGWAPRHIPEFVARCMDRALSHKVLFGSEGTGWPGVERRDEATPAV